MNFDDHSRFTRNIPIIVNGVVTMGAWQRPSWLIHRPEHDRIHTYYVTNRTEGRPDLISNEVYNTPYLDWVIVAFNNPLENLNWPRAGTTIEYPDDSVVYTEL